jgi:uncharacterized phage protein (TIGR02218 family)
MKSISASLATHLASETTSLCTLWKITRTDGQIFGFTDASSDITYSGTTYLASTGHSPSAIKTTADMSVDNLEVVSVLDSSTLTEQDIVAGKWDYATVDLMMVNYSDLTAGHLKIRKGTIGQIKLGRNQFAAELRGLAQALQQTMGVIITPACRANLGDTKCAVTLASYTTSGTVTSVTSNSVFADTSLTAVNGYYDYGLVTWVGGLNSGLMMEVKTFLNSGGSVTLQMTAPYDINVGDTYTISAGCDKTRTTCVAKFNNIANFRGYPDLPGQDKIIQTP